MWKIKSLSLSFNRSRDSFSCSTNTPSSTCSIGAVNRHCKTTTITPSSISNNNNTSSRSLLSAINSSTECLLVLILLFSTLSNTTQECPAGCECKWKSGKESVSCSRARLRSIPQGLNPNTQVLELPGNLIERLPSQVFLKLNLLNLQKIFLSECQLVSLETDTFAKLSNLIELELSGNRLDMIPSHAFEYVSELRELKLNSNPIVRISNDAFVALPRLVRLELTGCRLGTIETWAFRGLPSLQWLRLDNNRLLTIQAESFFPLRSLHGLEIAGNPWNCSCTLQPWREWLIKNNVPFGVPPICFYPKRLEGKSWNQLQLEDFACIPKITSSTDQERISRVVEGENGTLLCRLHTTPDTQVRWLNGNKGSGVPVTNGSVGTISSSSAFVLTESFVKSSSSFPIENDSSSYSSSSQVLLDEFASSANIGRPRTTTSRTNSGDRSLGLKISRLDIIHATPREAGIYICTAETKAGLISANFTLQVLQTKTENITGRLLFTGALVAAFLLFIVCLLLVCVIVGSRRLQYAASGNNTSRTITAEKIELNNTCHENHIDEESRYQNHHRHRNNHHNSTEGQNGGNSIPLMRNEDDEDIDETKGGGLTNNYYLKALNPSGNDHSTKNPQSKQQPQPSKQYVESKKLMSTNTSHSVSNISNTNSNKNLLPTTKKSNFRNVRPLSTAGAIGTSDCEYKALAVDEDDDQDDDEGDNNSESDDGFAGAEGESGDESCAPVVEIVNNNQRKNKIMIGTSYPNEVRSGHHNNNNGNVSSSRSNINKRPFSSSNNNNNSNSSNNNNNTSKPYELSPTLLGKGMLTTAAASASTRVREMRSNSSSIPQSTTSTTASPLNTQHHNLQPENSTNRANVKYPDLIDEKLPFTGTEYTSLPRPNKNRDPRIGSYFHRRNNSSESQYPLLSSSRGNSLEAMCSTELIPSSPFVSSSNPDSLSKVPLLSYLNSSRPPSAYLSQQQHRLRQYHPGTGGQLYKNNNGSFTNVYSNSSHSEYGMRWGSQRLSMPTSPVHRELDTQFQTSSAIPSATYDYHAAQLAAFLEEYRILQMELIRMSSSLTNNNNNNNNNNSVNPSFNDDYNNSTSTNNVNEEGFDGLSSLTTHTPNNNTSPCTSFIETNNLSSSSSSSRHLASSQLHQQQQLHHYNNPHHQLHEQSNQINSAASSNNSNATTRTAYHHQHRHNSSQPQQQLNSTSSSSPNSKPYSTNNITFDTSRPHSLVQPQNASSQQQASLNTEFQKFQYQQSNLKSILKNPGSTSSNNTTSIIGGSTSKIPNSFDLLNNSHDISNNTEDYDFLSTNVIAPTATATKNSNNHNNNYMA